MNILHKLLEKHAGIPGTIVDYIYNVNSNNPRAPKEGVHASDPEIAEVSRPSFDVRSKKKMKRLVREYYYEKFWQK